MNGTTGGTITVGTRLSFDGGLWEVTELTATAVVLRDALGGLRQVSISGLLADPATRLLDTAAAEMISVSRILRWHECAWDRAQPSANAMFGSATRLCGNVRKAVTPAGRSMSRLPRRTRTASPRDDAERSALVSASRS